jgi:hypothetical protein
MEVVGLIQILMVVAVNVIWCCFVDEKPQQRVSYTTPRQRQPYDIVRKDVCSV